MRMVAELDCDDAAKSLGWVNGDIREIPVNRDEDAVKFLRFQENIGIFGSYR